MARRGAGILGVALFAALQPNMLCGIHCALYMPVAMRLADAGVSVPLVACHHRRAVATAGHATVVSDVSTAPPARPMHVSPAVRSFGNPARATRATPSSTFPDVESPPPRTA